MHEKTNSMPRANLLKTILVALGDDVDPRQLALALRTAGFRQELGFDTGEIDPEDYLATPGIHFLNDDSLGAQASFDPARVSLCIVDERRWKICYQALKGASLQAWDRPLLIVSPNNTLLSGNTFFIAEKHYVSEQDPGEIARAAYNLVLKHREQCDRKVLWIIDDDYGRFQSTGWYHKLIERLCVVGDDGKEEAPLQEEAGSQEAEIEVISSWVGPRVPQPSSLVTGWFLDILQPLLKCSAPITILADNDLGEGVDSAGDRWLRTVCHLAPHAELAIATQGDYGSEYFVSVRVDDRSDPSDAEIAPIRECLNRARQPYLQQVSGKVATTQTDDIVGSSAAIQSVREKIIRYADREAPVLILGPPGSGKELVATALHNASSRSDNPMQSFNCASLVENLQASQLFGHVKGAFTGATEDRDGLFVAARGGTLFLDEIGDLAEANQPLLLRALQEKKVRPVCSNKEIPVNVRIVCATNRPLNEMVDRGGFRKDLYGRLAALVIRVPSLDERKEDIPELCSHFLKKLSQETHLGKTLTQEAIEILVRRSWPGNVRELKNVIDKLAHDVNGDKITENDVLRNPGTVPTPRSSRPVGRALELGCLSMRGEASELQSRLRRASARIRALPFEHLGLLEAVSEALLTNKDPGVFAKINDWLQKHYLRQDFRTDENILSAVHRWLPWSLDDGPQLVEEAKSIAQYSTQQDPAAALVMESFLTPLEESRQEMSQLWKRLLVPTDEDVVEAILLRTFSDSGCREMLLEISKGIALNEDLVSEFNKNPSSARFFVCLYGDIGNSSPIVNNWAVSKGGGVGNIPDIGDIVFRRLTSLIRTTRLVKLTNIIDKTWWYSDTMQQFINICEEAKKGKRDSYRRYWDQNIKVRLNNVWRKTVMSV